MNPITGKLIAVMGFSLSNLIFMMRELQIEATAMDVDIAILSTEN